MKKIFLSIENFLVTFSRIFWVIISLLSFLVAIVFLILALNKFFSTEGDPKIQLPLWSEIRNSILPPEITKTNTTQENNSSTITNLEDNSFYLTEFSDLLESIYINFEDYPELIRGDITKSSLKVYINSYLDNISKEEEIDKKDIILGLTKLLEKAYEEKDLLKIGNYNNRLELLENSINNYFVRLDANIEIYMNEKFMLNAKLIANKAQSLIYFYIGAASIGTFVFLVLFIIIFRVENHIRKISKDNV
tara:strand:- start:2177 stop:2923 length:747 start_codon:yes stop_codon:yes gene_type:complete